MADNSKQIDDIINSTFNQLKNIVDANTVIGKTIKINEDIFIIVYVILILQNISFV